MKKSKNHQRKKRKFPSCLVHGVCISLEVNTKQLRRGVGMTICMFLQFWLRSERKNESNGHSSEELQHPNTLAVMIIIITCTVVSGNYYDRLLVIFRAFVDLTPDDNKSSNVDVILSSVSYTIIYRAWLFKWWFMVYRMKVMTFHQLTQLCSTMLCSKV